MSSSLDGIVVCWDWQKKQSLRVFKSDVRASVKLSAPAHSYLMLSRGIADDPRSPTTAIARRFEVGWDVSMDRGMRTASLRNVPLLLLSVMGDASQVGSNYFYGVSSSIFSVR